MELPDFLTRNSYGEIRLTGHRIGLLHVIDRYDEGCSPEEILREYPTLSLDLIRKVIAFSADHRVEVEAYIAAELAEIERQAAEPSPGPTLVELPGVGKPCNAPRRADKWPSVSNGIKSVLTAVAYALEKNRASVHHGISDIHHGTGGPAMHRRISTTLNTLRQDLAARLGGDFIVTACRAAGHTWSDSCLLTPAAIIHWFLIQIFHGNTALTHVSLWPAAPSPRPPSAKPVPPPAGRLPAVLREMVKVLIPATEAVGLWLGHRIFLIDGSTFSMPDTPECKPTSASRATRPKAVASR